MSEPNRTTKCPKLEPGCSPRSSANERPVANTSLEALMEKWHDMVLVFDDGQQLKVNKGILRMTSDVFCDMLSSEDTGPNHGTVLTKRKQGSPDEVGAQ